MTEVCFERLNLDLEMQDAHNPHFSTFQGRRHELTVLERQEPVVDILWKKVFPSRFPEPCNYISLIGEGFMFTKHVHPLPPQTLHLQLTSVQRG